MPRTSKSTTTSDSGKTKLFMGGYFACGAFLVFICIVEFTGLFSVQYNRADAQSVSTSTAVVAAAPVVATLDKVAYDAKLIKNANYPVSTSTSTASSTTHHLWPVHTAYPNAGALLPFHRIVAYYGNFYSTHMGVLGQYPTAQMLTVQMVSIDSACLIVRYRKHLHLLIKHMAL